MGVGASTSATIKGLLAPLLASASCKLGGVIILVGDIGLGLFEAGSKPRRRFNLGGTAPATAGTQHQPGRDSTGHGWHAASTWAGQNRHWL